MKTLIAAAAGVLMLALTGGAVRAADTPVHLTLSHWVPPSHPLQAAFEGWAKSIAAESHGSITITIYPAQQLGKAFDHYDMARDDIADITHVSPGYQPGRFPIIALGSMPFLVTNAKGGSAALDAWYRAYAPKEMGDVHFCLAHFHDPGTFHSNKKIVVPADIRGLKVRPATGTIGEFVTLLGGTNVQAAAPEARDVIARGVADAITFPWRSLILFGIDKVVKYHLDMPLYVTPFVLVMNKGKYEAMSPAQKKVIDDHCTTQWAEKLASPWADYEHSGRAMIKAEPGQIFIEPTAAQIDEWRKAALPLRKEWADTVRKKGYDPTQIFAAFEASLKKYGAAY
jgi:TRAP-type C4-dicarboxylate transport system substrate-binding protein